MKTTQEWLLAFNQYFNNITSNKAPGFDPYEISVFLTDAQDAIVLGICNGALGNSFEATEDVTNYLSSLVKQVTITEEAQDPMYDASSSADVIPYYRIAGDKSHVYPLPSDLLFRTSEFCQLDYSACGDPIVAVIPVTQDEYWRTSRNPFKKQSSKRVLRLVYSKNGVQSNEYHGEKFSELISDYDIKNYIVRYIKYPEPIILAEDLASRGLTIRGETGAKPCLLDEALHSAILTKAVQIAQSVWSA